MEKRYDNHLIYRIIRFGLEKDVFKLGELFEHLQVDEHTRMYIYFNLIKSTALDDNPNFIISVHGTHFFSRSQSNADKQLHIPCTILPNAIFQYNDYLEIKAAREAAQEARVAANKANNLAMYAIIISVALTCFQLIIAALIGK